MAVLSHSLGEAINWYVVHQIVHSHILVLNTMNAPIYDDIYTND